MPGSVIIEIRVILNLILSPGQAEKETENYYHLGSDAFLSGIIV
jgi:hypothetical protein